MTSCPSFSSKKALSAGRPPPSDIGFSSIPKRIELFFWAPLPGLFDGTALGPLNGSTSEGLRLLAAPIHLVEDFGAMSGNAAAVVQRFCSVISVLCGQAGFRAAWLRTSTAADSRPVWAADSAENPQRI